MLLNVFKKIKYLFIKRRLNNIVSSFLSSPITFLQKHYKHKYHLKYIHAKKLFFIDMVLLFSISILIIFTALWLTYTPDAITDVYLKIDSSSGRIRSGEQISYLVEYENNSDDGLFDAQIQIMKPTGLNITNAEPTVDFDSEKLVFQLGDIMPGESGYVSFDGTIYGIPNAEKPITAILSFLKGESDQIFKVHNSLINILRESILISTIEAKDNLLSTGVSNITFFVKNDGGVTINNIENTIESPNGTELVGESLNKISNTKYTWTIDSLTIGQEKKLDVSLSSNLHPKTTKAELSITPSIHTDNDSFSQVKTIHDFHVLRPSIEMAGKWDNNTAKAGSTQKLNLTISNNGDVPVSNIHIILPINSTIINVTKLRQLNSGSIGNGKFIINPTNNTSLAKLESGSSIEYTIQIPIKKLPLANSISSLILNPSVSAQIVEAGNDIFEKNITLSELKIKQDPRLTATIKYYTPEGDQLGRGPLPPTVGEKTKYWAVIYIQNAGNKLRDISFSANLPSNVSWTEKNSVSHGSEPVYKEEDRSIHWSLNSLAGLDTIGLFFELALKPLDSDRGTTPNILENIVTSVIDSVSREKILIKHPDLNISLTSDPIGSSHGYVVR